MSRRWTDPRDGTAWLVDAVPFGLGPAADQLTPAPVGWTMLFASEGDGANYMLPVGYEMGTDVGGLGDDELMALLDAARD